MNGKNLRERERELRDQKVNEICLEIMEQVLKRGFSYSIPRRELENAMNLIGFIDERTWPRWIRALELREYVIVTAPNIYKINPVKIPRLFELLRNIPQTHLATPSLSQKIGEQKE